MLIGGKEFNDGHTHIMGILNVTPDSFSDGGKYTESEKAVKHALRMIEEGAEVIDVGGESTRPGYVQISEDEEIERVCPIIERIKKELEVPVSLDTYKGKVAKAGIVAGADMINDIWGLKYDSDMAGIIAENKVACCLMHNRDNTMYGDFIKDVVGDLMESVEIARNAGISEDRIILDPGVGFGKNYEHNLMVMRNLGRFNELGYPMLLGVSRKSVIGFALDLPKDERLEGTIATSVLAAVNRYSFVRVHDVKENYRAVKMTEVIYG